MALGGPDLQLGRVTKQQDKYFTCPNCEGSNGTMTYVFSGFVTDGPTVTRCDDCGYCDRCGRADS